LADENLVTNLFGDRVQEPRQGRGRRPHVWTRENSDRALLAFVLGRSVAEAAKLIGVSEPTFRKVYFKEVALREQARAKMELRQLERLNRLAEDGNVSADKEFGKLLDKIRVREAGQSMAAPKPTKAEKRGKKELQREAASQVRGLYEPIAAPTRLN